MTFADRIIQPDGKKIVCPYVELDEKLGEHAHYRGCGWCIVETDGQAVVDITYVYDICAVSLLSILEKVAQGGEFWLAMASCYQLTEPRRLSLADLAT